MKIVNKSFFEKIISKELILIILFCLSLAIINFWYIRYDTNDDMIFALSDYSFWKDVAQKQGRISFYFAGPLAMVPHIFNDVNYLSAVRVFSWMFLVILIGVFFYTLFWNKSVISVAVLIVSLLWANTLGGHNMLVSYPFYISFNLALFVIFMTSINFYMRAKVEINYILPCVLLGVVLLLGGEIYFQYFPFVALVVFYLSVKSRDENGISYKNLYLTLSVFVIIFAIIVSYKLIYQSVYGGNSQLNFDFYRVLYTFFVLTFGMSPGVQPFLNRAYIFQSPSFILAAIVIALCVVYALMRMRSKLETLTITHLTARDRVFVLMSFALALCAPNFLLALTQKYQSWVIDHSVSNYLYSSFSYVVMAIGLSAIVVLSARLRHLYIIVTIIVGLGVFITQVNNMTVGGMQRQASKKWELFDAAIKNVESFVSVEPPKIGLSDNFYDGIPQNYYWNAYASKKLNFKGVIEKGRGGDGFISYVPSRVQGPILLVGSNATIDSVITTEPCQLNQPCYLNSLRRYSDNLLGGEGGGSVRSIVLSGGGKVIGDTYSYRVQPSMERNRVLSFSFHDLASERLSTASVVFEKGVYGLETENGRYWRWAHTPVRLTISSTEADERDLRMDITPARDMVLTLSLNGKSQRVSAKKGVQQRIVLSSKIYRGESLLAIDSDVNSIRLNEKDPRFFSFMFNSIEIAGVE